MTKYPLEWGWDQSDASNPSTASEWKPKPTLLSGADPATLGRDDNIELAAAGDLKCQTICQSGGSFGTTGAYNVENKTMCRSCAVKTLKLEGLPGSEQNKFLAPHELK